MLSRLRDIGLVRRVLAIGPGFVDSFLRGNKVIPPVLAVMALLIFSWVVAGIFVGAPEEERVANQANVVAQSQDDPGDGGGSGSPAPQLESRDADSYAAYESKDPFRQLFAPAGSGEDTTPETTGGGPSPTEPTTPGGGETTGGGAGGGGAGGGSSGGFQDSDDDGLSDRRETALSQDPQNPDTDGDGTLDGADDADGDGVPDGRSRNSGGNAGGAGGGNGGAGSGGGSGGGDDGGLFDSGGSLP